MQKTLHKALIDAITEKRRELGGGKRLLALEKTAALIGISTSSLRSIIKYGESAVGDTIRPKLDAWLSSENKT